LPSRFKNWLRFDYFYFSFSSVPSVLISSFGLIFCFAAGDARDVSVGDGARFDFGSN
jgi:hypothetical protein